MKWRPLGQHDAQEPFAPAGFAPGRDGIKEMNTGRERTTILPIKRSITLIYVSSLVIAILMAVASIAGLRYRATVYPTVEL